MTASAPRPECAECAAPATLTGDAPYCETCYWEAHPRCDRCGECITDGYATDDGERWCSLDCAGMTQEQYDAMHDADGDAAAVYWTEWEDWADDEKPDPDWAARVAVLGAFPDAPAPVPPVAGPEPDGGDDDACRECNGDAPHGDRPHKGDALCWDCYRSLYGEGFLEGDA